MTSEAVVWTWLPGAVAPSPPVGCARPREDWPSPTPAATLDRADAPSLYGPELPLRSGPIEPLPARPCHRAFGTDRRTRGDAESSPPG